MSAKREISGCRVSNCLIEGLSIGNQLSKLVLPQCQHDLAWLVSKAQVGG